MKNRKRKEKENHGLIHSRYQRLNNRGACCFKRFGFCFREGRIYVSFVANTSLLSVNLGRYYCSDRRPRRLKTRSLYTKQANMKHVKIPSFFKT